MAAKPKRIGEILVEQGLITTLQLEKALKEGGGRVGKTLVRMGFVADADITKALANQYNLDYIDLRNVIIEPSIVAIIPETTARKNTAIPVSSKNDTLTVAVHDPLNVLAIDNVSKHTNLRVKLALATEFDILNAINRHYVAAKSIEDVVNADELGNLELATGNSEAAARIAATIAEKHPASNDRLVLLSRIHLQRAEFDQALLAARTLAAKQPRSSLPLKLLGDPFLL